MAERRPSAPKKRRAYQPPKLEAVQVVAEEALLAACVQSASNPTSVFQGAPCEACFTNS